MVLSNEIQADRHRHKNITSYTSIEVVKEEWCWDCSNFKINR